MQGIPVYDGIRYELRSRWPEWLSVSAFAAVVAFAIPYHEPWVDEAQAWQLARSLSLRELFQTHIRYEATPGLWHFLLWILNRAHVSYAGMHWICGGIAVVSTSILAFHSPFPRYIKLTLPFTFFLLFQYAVVARGYVLVPLMLFVIAWWWKRSPLAVSIVLGLLANCALHAAVISGGLAIVWLVEQLRAGAHHLPARRAKLLLCASIVLSLYAFAVWTSWPPSDMAGHIEIFRSMRPSFIDSALAALFIPTCQPAFLSVFFWIVIFSVFVWRRSLLYLLPVLFFAVFSGVVPSSFWHWGLAVPLLVCLLWMTWPSPEPRMLPHEIAGRTALIYMIGVQILWSAYAIHFDHFNAYSADRAAAQFLRPLLGREGKVAVTSIDDHPMPISNATGILPYFNRNIYMNQPEPFYLWSDKNDSDSLFDALLPSHPAVVLAEYPRRQAELFIAQKVSFNNPSVS